MFADGNSVNGVRSLETQTELLEYATNVFPKHLHALVEIGDLNGAVEEYSLGEPFTVFNVEEMVLCQDLVQVKTRNFSPF